MRLKQSISINNKVSYSIIMDYTNLNGKRSTCIYETLGNMEKLKSRFGEENTMEEVQKYIKSLNDQVKNGKEPIVNIALNPNKQIPKDVNRSFYSGNIILRKIYYQLGIDKICENIKEKYKFEFDINAIMECLLYGRIIWPSSKLSTYKQSKTFLGNYEFDLQHVYRTLSYLAKEINNIQAQLFDYSNKVIDRNYKVIYYDCTNYFFYTEENDFKSYGISKQHQPLPLVQMGLFMDADGYPFAMNINPGNTSETKTMLPTEKEFLKNYNMDGKNIIVCTDAAMCSDQIKKYNVEEGRGFITTQSIKQLKAELKTFALDKNGWRILGNLRDIYNLEEIEKDEELKSKYYNTIFYKETECETKSVKQALIITFSFKYQAYQHKLKSHQLERAQILVDKTNKKNENIKNKSKIEKIKVSINPNDPKRFIEQVSSTEQGKIANNILYKINIEKYNDEEKYNGLYGITTNLMNDTQTIIKVMNGRWEIEESFRIMKEDFDSGTVHLSKEDRIKGHFITCFIALFMYRYLEHKLNDKYTVHEIISTLQEMKMLEHTGKGFEPIQKRTDLTDDLHRYLGLNTDNEILTYKKIKEIFNQK